MKIKTVRASGLPIQGIEAYQEEYRNMYDRVIKELGLERELSPSEEQTKQAQARLEAEAVILHKKYPLEVEWDLIKSKKKWRALTEEYGIIAVVSEKDTKGINYVIMDIEI